MKDIILANIGNTNTEIAYWDGRAFNAIEHYKTDSLLDSIEISPIIKNNPGKNCLAACVVPAIQERISQGQKMLTIDWLTAEMVSGVDFSLVEKSSIGADRLANAACAVKELELPAIIVDCGTAISLEIIDQHNRFLGGIIMPGRCLAYKALNTGTGQLPNIAIEGRRPHVIGRNTKEAIKSGVEVGLLGALDRIITEIKFEIKNPKLMATVIGGDSVYFAENLGYANLGPEHFTLNGLRIIGENLTD